MRSRTDSNPPRPARGVPDWLLIVAAVAALAALTAVGAAAVVVLVGRWPW